MEGCYFENLDIPIYNNQRIESLFILNLLLYFILIVFINKKNSRY